mmetsp:Transcript_2131/g.5405  ORF Transcript_2131/g.5405 Transcript_2131/m.5405 type:complete len:91 (-) Transcript_2131:298-570(-)
MTPASMCSNAGSVATTLAYSRCPSYAQYGATFLWKLKRPLINPIAIARRQDPPSNLPNIGPPQELDLQNHRQHDKPVKASIAKVTSTGEL